MCKSLPEQIKLETIPEGNFITSPPAQFMAQYQKGKFLITRPGLADTNEWLLLKFTVRHRISSFKLLLRCFREKQFSKKKAEGKMRNSNCSLSPHQTHTPKPNISLLKSANLFKRCYFKKDDGLRERGGRSMPACQYAIRFSLFPHQK